MILGLRTGELLSLVGDARRLQDDSARVAVSGPGAGEIAAALAAGGEAGTVLVDADPLRASVAVRIVNGEVSSADAALLRRLTRAGQPTVVLRRGAMRIPHILPGNVVDAGHELPVAELATAIARVSGEAAPSLAARLPVVRDAVTRRLIGVTAASAAILAAAERGSRADLPLLTLAQTRMLLQLGLSRGDRLPSEPRQLAVAIGPWLAAPLGLGVGARTLVRSLPVGGAAVRASVASAGTLAIAALRLRL
jgi:hypothetical protein